VHDEDAIRRQAIDLSVLVPLGRLLLQRTLKVTRMHTSAGSAVPKYVHRQPKGSLCSWLRNHPIITKASTLLTSTYNLMQILTKHFPLWTLIPLPGDFKIISSSSSSRNQHFKGYHVQTGDGFTVKLMKLKLQGCSPARAHSKALEGWS
jgi:hypothetical protein